MNTPASTLLPARKDRLLQEHIHNPYQARKKRAAVTVCRECHALFSNGRWYWADSWPADSPTALCEACRRIKEGYAAGVVTIAGRFVAQHKEEILNLVRHIEKCEMAEHPLHRIMKIAQRRGSIEISTTDIHLPRRVGEALHRAHKGRLYIHYCDETCFVRVNWTREP